MKIHKIASLGLILVLISTFSMAQELDRSKLPVAGPVPEIDWTDAESFQLDNGLKVVFVENHKMPRLSFSLRLNLDPILEKEKIGHISMAGDLMRSGTKSRTKKQIDEEIDFMGAALSTSASGIYASSLTRHRDKLLDIMTDVLYNPSFPEDEFQKSIKQIQSSLKANEDEPEYLMGNVASVLNYGKDHPYGEIVTDASLKNITLQDCKNFYEQYYKPNKAHLAIVGDITLEEVKKIVNEHFAKWKKGKITYPPFTKPEEPTKNQVAVVDRPQAVQSNIQITYPVDLKYNNPDYIKVKLLSFILGGSFQGRINQNLRETHGYTYGAYGGISSDEFIGKFTAQSSVRNDVTDSAIHEVLYEMQRIIDEPVDESELALAKSVMYGSFGRSLESLQTIAGFAINIDKYDLPRDYYRNYLKELEKVTVKDIQEMAAKYIHPDKAYIIVVGRSEDIGDKLEQFGPVTYYDKYGNKVEKPKEN